MERNELANRIEERLRAAGLRDFVDRDRSQLLDFPGEFFVEIVLKDAEKLEEATSLLDKLAREFEGQGTRIDFVVRAIWDVVRVTPEFDLSSAADVVRQGLLSLPYRASSGQGSANTRFGSS